MQKHSDRMDKRPTITGGSGPVGMDYWSKPDLMSVYYQQQLSDHSRLGELVDPGREAAAYWDSRNNTSAFSPLQAAATDTSKPASLYDNNQFLKSNGQQVEHIFYFYLRLARLAQSVINMWQDIKGVAGGGAGGGLNISLSQISRYASDKQGGMKPDQQ